MVSQEEGFHSLAKDAQTIVQQDKECVSEKTPSLVTELADLLAQLAKQGDRMILSELFNVLTDILVRIKVQVVHQKRFRLPTCVLQKHR